MDNTFQAVSHGGLCWGDGGALLHLALLLCDRQVVRSKEGPGREGRGREGCRK